MALIFIQLPRFSPLIGVKFSWNNTSSGISKEKIVKLKIQV
ncbi:MAG: hypothetical protein ACTSVI_00225 [Promethearchaeota archaeon]